MRVYCSLFLTSYLLSALSFANSSSLTSEERISIYLNKSIDHNVYVHSAAAEIRVLFDRVLHRGGPSDGSFSAAMYNVIWFLQDPNIHTIFNAPSDTVPHNGYIHRANIVLQALEPVILYLEGNSSELLELAEQKQAEVGSSLRSALNLLDSVSNELPKDNRLGVAVERYKASAVYQRLLESLEKNPLHNVEFHENASFTEDGSGSETESEVSPDLFGN